MRRVVFFSSGLGAALLLSACVGAVEAFDSGVPAKARDAGAADAGGVDAGGPDAGAGDAGVDAGSPDAGVRDAGWWVLGLVPPSSLPAPAAVAGPTVVVMPPGGRLADGGAPAFTNIALAIAAVSDGGTVLVEPGVYRGPMRIEATRGPVNVLAASGRPVIDCSTPLPQWTSLGNGVYETTPPYPVRAVFIDGVVLPRTRYPVTGFATIADTDSSGPPYRSVSVSPTDRPTLTSRSLTQALITVRMVDWAYNTTTVTGFGGDGGALTLAPGALARECTHPNCSLEFPAMQGWGYYLENEAWMLAQSPGWAYDATANRLRVRLADQTDPSSRGVSASDLVDCVVVAAAENLTLSGITVTNSGRDGLVFETAYGARLHRVEVINAAHYALILSNSDRFVVDESRFGVTGIGCVLHGVPWNLAAALDSHFESNLVEQCGRMDSPKESPAGFRSWPARSTQLNYRHNLFRQNAGVGVWLVKGAVFEDNTLEDHCLAIDDCGAIYGSGYTPDVTVRRNVIHGVHAFLDGKGRGAYPANGIYLDDFATGSTVEGNQVYDVDIGMFLHNAFDVTVRDNVFHGATRGSVYLQEDSIRKRYEPSTLTFDPVLVQGNTVPAMVNDVFAGNAWVDPPGAVPLHHASYLRSGLDGVLGAYAGTGNQYWTFFTPRGIEATPATYELVDLQPQGIDVPESIPRVSDRFSVQSVGTPSLVLSASTVSSFSTYTGTGAIQLSTPTCASPGTSGLCLRVDGSSAGNGLLVSPSFPATAGQLYRVTLQVRREHATPRRYTGVLRVAGPNSYDDLNSLHEQLAIRAVAGPWSTRTFFVLASTTVPAARFDIELPAGDVLVVGGLEVVPVTGTATVFGERAFAVTNASFTESLDAGCPLGGCSTAWRERDGGVANGPMLVPPRQTGLRWRP